MRDPDYPVSITIHVSQIAEYLRFDEEIRNFHHSYKFNSYPMGYPEFCRIWNAEAAPDDSRRFSTLFLAEDPRNNEAEPSDNPALLSDFHITAAQAGLTSDEPINSKDNITHEYATLMADKQRKQREFIEERRQNRIRAFDSGKITPFRAPNHSSHQPRGRKRNRNKKFKLNKRETTVQAASEVNTTTETSPTQPEATSPVDSTNIPDPMDVTH